MSRKKKSGMGREGPNPENTPTVRSVSASSVSSWVDAHEGEASTYALNPPDTIVVGGVTFNDISGGASKQVTGARTTNYTTNYQSSQQASNGEYPVIQVTVTETTRRSKGGTVRSYAFNKRETGLW